MAEQEVLEGADAQFGYRFGCEGFIGLKEACEFLGGITMPTLQKRVDDGYLRKGKHPGGRTAVICKRSLREYVARMEL